MTKDVLIQTSCVQIDSKKPINPSLDRWAGSLVLTWAFRVLRLVQAKVLFERRKRNKVVACTRTRPCFYFDQSIDLTAIARGQKAERPTRCI